MVQINPYLAKIAGLIVLAGPIFTNASTTTVLVTEVVYQTSTNVHRSVSTVYVTETYNAGDITSIASSEAQANIDTGVAANVVTDTTSTTSSSESVVTISTIEIPLSASSFETVWTSGWTAVSTSEWLVSDTATTSSSSTATAAATSAVSTAITGSVDKNFAKTILAAHNEKRALHGTSNLGWNDTVYQYAQAYADKYDCSGNLVHSGGEYGENIAFGFNTSTVTDAWYSEYKYYNYSDPGYSEKTGHFTQVIWKDTTQLGCAYVTCSDDVSGDVSGQYTICSYYFPGNFVGAEHFRENVLPLV